MGPAEQGWLLMTATKTEAGTFRVAVTGSQQSGPFLRLPDAMGATSPELMALLAGQKAHLIFNGLGDMAKGRLGHGGGLALPGRRRRRRSPAAQPGQPADPRDLRGQRRWSTTCPRDPGFDQDCDQAPEADDMDPNGEPPPQIFGEPASPLRLQVGDTATLKVSTGAADVTFRWKGSDPTLQLGASEGRQQHHLPPPDRRLPRGGRRRRRGGAESRYVWDVLVDAPDTRTMNTPPEVKIASSAAVARVGEVIALLAVGRDREQRGLRFRWRPTTPPCCR